MTTTTKQKFIFFYVNEWWHLHIGKHWSDWRPANRHQLRVALSWFSFLFHAVDFFFRNQLHWMQNWLGRRRFDNIKSVVWECMHCLISIWTADNLNELWHMWKEKTPGRLWICVFNMRENQIEWIKIDLVELIRNVIAVILDWDKQCKNRAERER